jgi:hypothetical protein
MTMSTWKYPPKPKRHNRTAIYAVLWLVVATVVIACAAQATEKASHDLKTFCQLRELRNG